MSLTVNRLYPIAAVLWTAVVFYVCLLPSSDVPAVPWMDFPFADKLVHMVLFGVLCWVYCYTAFAVDKRHPCRNILLSAGLSIFMGVFIECLQGIMVNGRSFEYTDILADTAATLGVAKVVSIMKRGNKN